MSTKGLVLPIVEKEIDFAEKCFSEYRKNPDLQEELYYQGYLDAMKKVKSLLHGIGVEVISTKFPRRGIGE